MRRGMSTTGILIVDDDKRTRESLRMFLEFEGFSVDDCESGEFAFALLDKKCFDVYLIDYQMPDMQGDEVMRMLRPRCPDAYMIGFSLESKDRAFLAAGANAFVRKDELVHELIPLIQNRMQR